MRLNRKWSLADTEGCMHNKECIEQKSLLANEIVSGKVLHKSKILGFCTDAQLPVLVKIGYKCRIQFQNIKYGQYILTSTFNYLPH